MSDGEDSDDDMLFMCGLDLGEGFEDATEDESCSIREPLPVKRVEYASLTPEEFEEQYFIPNKPVILTKADKPKADELAARRAEIEQALRSHAAAMPEVLATSARKGSGIAELRADLATLATDS